MPSSTVIVILRISIHALLAESDEPCQLSIVIHIVFLSTLSLRRATKKLTSLNPHHPAFLSTLSLRRATPEESGQRHSLGNFYPRSPCGERL